jgi:integrase
MAKRRGKNEGSIWKQGGFWRAALVLDGQRLTRSFKSKEECKDWIREIKNQIDGGLTFNATRTTLFEFLDQWLDIHSTKLRRRTGPQYRQLAQDYIMPVLGKYLLRELRLEQIDALYRSLLRKGVSVRTVRYVHAVLHRCLNEAVKRGLIGANPSHGATLPPLEQEEMKILDENQVMRFLIAAQESRYEVLYHLAIKTGMRKAELLGLKWDDLDWQKGTLKVQRQLQRIPRQGFLFVQPKTKSGRRTIQLGGQTLLQLRSHLERQRIEQNLTGERWQDQGLMFTSTSGTPIDQRNLHRDFKAILKKAHLGEIRFHDLRHTAASLMLNNGVPVLVVSKILGHAKPSTTTDIYGHLIPMMQEEAARIMDEIVTPIPVDLGKPMEVEEPPSVSNKQS